MSPQSPHPTRRAALYPLRLLGERPRVPIRAQAQGWGHSDSHPHFPRKSHLPRAGSRPPWPPRPRPVLRGPETSPAGNSCFAVVTALYEPEAPGVTATTWGDAAASWGPGVADCPSAFHTLAPGTSWPPPEDDWEVGAEESGGDADPLCAPPSQGWRSSSQSRRPGEPPPGDAMGPPRRACRRAPSRRPAALHSRRPETGYRRAPWGA